MTHERVIPDPPPVPRDPTPRDLEARPERLVIVARRVEDGRFLFVRWPDWPHPAMLSTAPPGEVEGLATGIASLLRARVGVEVPGTPRLAERRQPARMPHPYAGSEGLGWLRALGVEVAGEPEADALLEDVVALTHAEALEALPSDLERLLFQEGAALLEGGDA